MARIEMRWWRYRCSGQTLTGKQCQGTALVSAIDEANADRVVREVYEWSLADGKHFCPDEHAERAHG